MYFYYHVFLLSCIFTIMYFFTRSCIFTLVPNYIQLTYMYKDIHVGLDNFVFQATQTLYPLSCTCTYFAFSCSTKLHNKDINKLAIPMHSMCSMIHEIHFSIHAIPQQSQYHNLLNFLLICRPIFYFFCNLDQQQSVFKEGQYPDNL